MDRKELIRRLLDGELDPADEELRGRLDDATFTEELSRARQLQADLRRLGQVPDPGPALTDRIMTAVGELAAPSTRHRTSWWQWLRRPVAMPAWGMALGVVAVVVLVGRLTLFPAPPRVVKVAMKSAEAHCPSPQVLVRFVLKAPQARQVNLVGDFNQWSVDGTPLTDPDQDGIWTVVLPVEPGRYQYKFVIDKQQWVVDPDATAFQPDGFGGRNALLAI